MNVLNATRLPLGWIALAALGLLALTPTVSWAQEEQIEPEGDTEKNKLVKDQQAEQAVQDSLIGPDSFTNPSVRQDLNYDYPTPFLKFGKSSSLKWNLSVLGRFQTRNNFDFRENDNSSQQAAIDSDDALSYGLTQLLAGMELKINDRVSVQMSIVNNGVWGSGSLSGLAEDNTLLVNTLFFDWALVDVPGVKLTARVGRQFYGIGGAPRDYFFRDVVDGVTLNAEFGQGGALRVLVADIVGAQRRPDEVDFYTRAASGTSGQNFDGATNTYRTGAVYENTKLVDGLDLRAFGYMAFIGAGQPGLGSGSDLSFGGGLGNFRDKDYNFMAGTRVGYYFEDEAKTLKIGGYGEYARSGGIDRQSQVYGLQDIDAGGNAFGAGIVASSQLGSLTLDFNADFFRADGPTYSKNGMAENSGFVSMKGNHVGGLAMDDTIGWHPSAYVGSAKGLEMTPQDQQRKAGTQAIHAQAGIGLVDTLKVTFDFWHLTDTGATFVEEADIPAVSQDLPFGYSQADLEAQQRLGKTLGIELGTGITYLASDLISAYAQGAVFLPGEFYENEITRSGGNALGSVDPQTAWVVVLGTTMQWK